MKQTRRPIKTEVPTELVLSISKVDLIAMVYKEVEKQNKLLVGGFTWGPELQQLPQQMEDALKGTFSISESGGLEYAHPRDRS